MFKDRESNLKDFMSARYGMFVHYGLYSVLGRGEWVMNRERIPHEEYRKLANEFTAEKFDAEEICRLAVDSGMKYVIFTTMHHDGFCLYDSDLTDFTSVKTAAKRDLTAEMVAAAKKYGLRIHLYHSLNNWGVVPDGCDALEDPEKYKQFIANTHARIKELVTKYNPIDVLWYDGWWPFNAEGWQAEAMNQMVLDIQPHILFNGRNGLPGDFGTPEGHITAPTPWRPWEACMTLNDHWGFCKYDNNWKSPIELIGMQAKVAQGRGNLVVNIGPRGDGSIPEVSSEILLENGGWLRRNHEAIFNTDIFTFGLMERKPEQRADFVALGDFTASGNNLYFICKYWCGNYFKIGGLKSRPLKVSIIGGEKDLDFEYNGELLTVTGLTEEPPAFCPVFKIECEEPPEIYTTGGMRVPNAPHPPYDPCESDIGE